MLKWVRVYVRARREPLSMETAPCRTRADKTVCDEELTLSKSFITKKKRKEEWPRAIFRLTGSFIPLCSVMGKVEHCLIFQTSHGFGFDKNQASFPTLKSLVMHYNRVSLEEHNRALQNTTLAMPVHASGNSQQVVQPQQQQQHHKTGN